MAGKALIVDPVIRSRIDTPLLPAVGENPSKRFSAKNHSAFRRPYLPYADGGTPILDGGAGGGVGVLAHGREPLARLRRTKQPTLYDQRCDRLGMIKQILRPSKRLLCKPVQPIPDGPPALRDPPGLPDSPGLNLLPSVLPGVNRPPSSRCTASPADGDSL